MQFETAVLRAFEVSREAPAQTIKPAALLTAPHKAARKVVTDCVFPGRYCCEPATAPRLRRFSDRVLSSMALARTRIDRFLDLVQKCQSSG